MNGDSNIEIEPIIGSHLVNKYQNSEIGVIPIGWRIIKLGEIGSFKKGKGIKKDEVKTDGYPCIRYGELYTIHHEYVKSINSYIDQNTAKDSQKIKQGDILFAGSGETKEEIGKCAAYLGTEEAYAGGDIIILTPKDFNSLFLGFLLNHNSIQSQKAQNGQGDAVVHIYQSGLSNIKLVCPPLSEQTAIATALSDADALIRSLVQLIEKKKNIKQGAMQELLTGKVRLPGFEIQQGLKNTEIGPISTDWDLKLLGDCLLKSPDYGINAAAVNYNSDLPTYLRITDISDEGKFVSMNKVSVDNLYSRNYYLEDDDIVFARTGASVGKSYLYNIKDGLLVFAGFLIRIKLNSHILIPRYLKYFSQTPVFWNWVLTNSMRSGQPGINSCELKSLLIKMPNSVKEQKAICDILDSMDEEISILQLKLNKYNCIKQGMMQNLLTGKIRLI